jgi:Signal transduction histidine kinase
MSKITQKARDIAGQIPIRWRLTLVSLGLLVCLTSGLGLIILLTAEQALLTNGAMALHNEAQLAITGIKGHPFSAFPTADRPLIPNAGDTSPGGTDPLNAQFQVLINRLAGASANAEILSLDGETIIARTDAPLAPPSVILSPTLIRQQHQSDQNDTSYMLAPDVQGKRQQVVLIPLFQNQTMIGILQISTPTTSVDTFITTLRLILLFGIIGAIGIGITLTFPLISVTLRPLVAMERASRDIAEGELSRRLTTPVTNDEIGQLAVSFNRMVAQLETSIKQQKQFVANVSHELRTPLTALHGSLEILLMGADKGDVASSRRLMQGMYTEIKRMQRLIEDLLTLTRLDEGKLVAHNETFLLRTVLDAIYDHAQQLAHGQEIIYHITPGTLLIHADQDRLQRVIINIVDNALKFTPHDGRIQIEAHQNKQGKVIITVQDSGIGIARDALPHIFDRFYRSDAARSRQPMHIGGNGLGLAIAKELIEVQGGEISIDSTPGVGTTVTLQLCGTDTNNTTQTSK